MNQPLMLHADFPGMGKPASGKVRDIFDLHDCLALVATDRISAFDVILPNGIEDKGEVLTMITVLWLLAFADVPNHLISCDPSTYPAVCRPYAQALEGRSMLVKKAKPFKVECVVRGYLAGSGWKLYQQGKDICGLHLPTGLVESQELPDGPIFTPTTKAETGHDENITFEQTKKLVGASVALTMRKYSLDLYRRAQKLAKQAGIIIADTKFEFGLLDGKVILIDEVLTPDSSRFWPVDGYKPGRGQPSFDKQFVRDYLESLNWNKQPPAPELPPDIVEKTRQKYLEAYQRLSSVLAS